METFRPFSPLHAGMLALFVVVCGTLIVLRRRLRGTGRAVALDRLACAGAAAACAFTIIGPLWPGVFTMHWSLPLHVCDVTAFAVPVALGTCWRPARAVTYFWGIGLSSQGLVTPDLRDGPAKIWFWLFWANHFAVVGGAIYDVAARGYRPGWKDLGIALALGLAYVAVIVPLDVAFGLNYGYLGRSPPGQPTLVDVLGPWPWRVPVMLALAALAMVVLLLPWEAARWIKARDPRPRQ